MQQIPCLQKAYQDRKLITKCEIHFNAQEQSSFNNCWSLFKQETTLYKAKQDKSKKQTNKDRVTYYGGT